MDGRIKYGHDEIGKLGILCTQLLPHPVITRLDRVIHGEPYPQSS